MGDLNNHHSDTLTAIFQHPTSHNVRWHDTLSLLEAVGTVEEKHDGKFRVTIGQETEGFSRPHDKDIDEQMIIDLRRMFKHAGFEPAAPGKEN